MYYNQILYIPISTNQKESKVKDIPLSVQKKIELAAESKNVAELNIALLMPYFLVKNDTMFNNFERNTEIPNTYYKKSEVALSFHVGIELALDSLRKQGRDIRLHTFDTNKDALKVHQIVK